MEALAKKVLVLGIDGLELVREVIMFWVYTKRAYIYA